jgi:predicted MFS family arabinose efflux permease
VIPETGAPAPYRRNDKGQVAPAIRPYVSEEHCLRDAAPPLSSKTALSAFNFFTACVQTGFGPFLPVYLTQSGWSQGAVGLALSLGSIASVVSQVPGGVVVDHVHRKRVVCAAALGALGLVALILAFWPSLVTVWSAQIVHAVSAAVLTPGIAALTLTLCGHSAFGERVGNNARYASLGNAAAAAFLGLVAYQLSLRAVFFLTAAMTVPALASLLLIRPDHIDPRKDHPALLLPRERTARPWHIFFELHMTTFAICVSLFTLANAAMLPIALNQLASDQEAAGLATTGSIVALQVVVVLFAPWIGKAAERWGRWPVLVAGFSALPLRGLLFATMPGPSLVVAIELLDGVSAAVIGVMIPLIAADLTRRTGFLNMAIGSFGLAASLGATFSTSLAGWIADRFGLRMAFLALAAAGAVALLVVLFIMPETRPADESLEAGPKARPA